MEEAQKLARQKIPSAAALQLHSFTFDDFGLGNDEMLQVMIFPAFFKRQGVGRTSLLSSIRIFTIKSLAKMNTIYTLLFLGCATDVH